MNNTVFDNYPSKLLDFAVVVFILFSILGVTGNFITIVALSKSKKLRNATTAFIINLCISDILLSGFSMPLSATTFLERGWNYGEALCKMFPLVRYSNGAVSVFTVIAITINRYILIVHPRIYNRVYNIRNMAMMIVIIWIAAFLLLLFPLIEVWGKLGYDPEVGTCTILKVNGKSPKITFYIAAFTLPFLVIIVCYTRIYHIVHTASKHSRHNIQMDIECRKSKNRTSRILQYYDMIINRFLFFYRQEKEELRVLKIMLAIFFTFILCYLPVSFVKIFRKEDSFPFLNVFGYLGVFFSSIINPVIYAALGEEYRGAYKELFCPKGTDI